MGTVKMLFGFLVLGVFVYLGVAILPVYYANYQFTDAVRTEAVADTYTTKSEAAIQDTLYRRAIDLGVPIEKEQLKVHRTGNLGNGSLTVEAPYTVRVNLPGYPLEIKFDASTTNGTPQ